MQNEWSEDATGSVWRPFAAALDPARSLDAVTFPTIARIPAGRSVRQKALTAYFDYVLDPSTGLSQDAMESYRLLEQAFATLTAEPRIFHCGEGQVVDTTVHIVGRISDGSVVGIWADCIET
jgi:hypothetical protein